jgi:hypothetical protein
LSADGPSFWEKKGHITITMEISHFNHRDHPDASVTTALLLAAGTGSRLEPLTTEAPKCLPGAE